MPRPPDLPNFSAPPIDEVVIGIILQPIDGFSDQLPVRLLDRLEDLGYSTFEVQQPIIVDEEHPDQPMPVPSVRVMPLPSARRFWLGTADESRIVQVQPDMLLSNWRRRGSADYPHFEELVAHFREVRSRYLETLAAAGAEAPELRQVDLTYINWVPDDLSIADWFRPARAAILDRRGVDPGPEAMACVSQYALRSNGQQIGRLRAECQVAAKLVEAQWVNGAQFSLRARIAVTGALDEADLTPMLEIARRAIVETFLDLTTEEAHSRWHRFN